MKGLNMRKTIDLIILLSVLMFCVGCGTLEEGKLYKRKGTIPLGPGLRLGVVEETEPKCDHDLSAVELMKVEAQKAAANWRKIAFWTSILAFGATVVWYAGHVPQAGGVAICSILYSAFSTLMAVAMSAIWILVLVSSVVLVIVIGIVLHKKSVFRWWRNKNGILCKETPEAS